MLSLRWEVQITVFVKRIEYTFFVNLGCCTCILPIMILLPGNKSLVSSATTSSIVKTIKMTATYMHLEKHSISKFSLTCGLGIVYWELNLANVSKPADLMTDWDLCCILLNCVTIAEWLMHILPLSQFVFQFPFIQTVNQTTLLVVIFTVFWQHCPGSYGKQNQGKLGKPLVFLFKSKINLIIHTFTLMRSFNRAPQQFLFFSFAMLHFCLFHKYPLSVFATVANTHP